MTLCDFLFSFDNKCILFLLTWCRRVTTWVSWMSHLISFQHCLQYLLQLNVASMRTRFLWVTEILFLAFHSRLLLLTSGRSLYCFSEILKKGAVTISPQVTFWFAVIFLAGEVHAGLCLCFFAFFTFIYKDIRLLGSSRKIAASRLWYTVIKHGNASSYNPTRHDEFTQALDLDPRG